MDTVPAGEVTGEPSIQNHSQASDCMQVQGKGLSALVEAQLCVPLDKDLQCSSWGSRPLSQAQVGQLASSSVLHHACYLSMKLGTSSCMLMVPLD